MRLKQGMPPSAAILADEADKSTHPNLTTLSAKGVGE